MKVNDSRLFESAKEQANQNNFNGALARLKKISPAFSWGREELLFKARLIQLSDAEFENEWDFVGVERSLNAALELDNENVEVLLELGFFHSRVMDDCHKGMFFFENALKRVEQQYAEGLTGIAECLEEQESEDAVWRYIEERLDSIKSKVKDSLRLF